MLCYNNLFFMVGIQYSSDTHRTKKVSRMMRALETFVEQIKEYGKLYDIKGTLHFHYEYYAIDDETYAIVVYDKDGNIHHATFRRR